jgi:hypothetical protein
VYIYSVQAAQKKKKTERGCQKAKIIKQKEVEREKRMAGLHSNFAINSFEVKGRRKEGIESKTDKESKFFFETENRGRRQGVLFFFEKIVK